jgi:cytochrome c
MPDLNPSTGNTMSPSTPTFRVLLTVAAVYAGAAQAQAPATGAPATTPATALPPGNADDGATIFKKCAACHEIGPTAKNSVGPVLNGVVGRMAGTYPGYAYSDANKSSGVVWTAANLAAYLPAPKLFMPGTKMSFAGLMMPQDVADVIAYLKQYDAQGNKVAP